MNEAINGSRGKGIIVIENRSPVSESPVGGHYDGATFIPVGDDLEEEFCPLLVHGKVAKFVNDEEAGRSKGFHGLEERLIGQRSGQVIDQIHGGGKEGFDSLEAGLIAQGQSQMSFSGSRGTHEDGIMFLFDEMEVKEVHDLGFMNGFGEREVEGIDGFDDREVSLGEAGFDSSLFPGGHFLSGEDQEEVSGGEVFLFPLFQGFLQDFGHSFEMKRAKRLFKFLDFHGHLPPGYGSGHRRGRGLFLPPR